jgi:hypothetical protein
VQLPIDRLHQALYKTFSQSTTKKHVFDIQNMPALLIPTHMAKHTLCTSVSEISEYEFITLILLCIQHIFDSQNMFTQPLTIVILHHTLGYTIHNHTKDLCFGYRKQTGIVNSNHYSLVHTMQ